MNEPTPAIDFCRIKAANSRPRKAYQQQGIALIAAIFLMVVLGSAVILLSTLSLRNAEQTTQSLLQMRAQQAVAAAQEYAVQQLIKTDGAACASIDGNSLSIDAFSEFNINIECTGYQYDGASQTIWLYNLYASAEYGSIDNPDYVWSELEFSVEF